MSPRLLSPEQIEVVRTYFKALAFFRDEEYAAPDDKLLASCTGTYATIMTDGGADPVKLASRLVFGEHGSDLTLI